MNSLLQPAFSLPTAAMKADINVQKIISTLSELYQRSKNISPFKNLYPRSHIPPVHPPSPKHQNPNPNYQKHGPSCRRAAKTFIQFTHPISHSETGLSFRNNLPIKPIQMAKPDIRIHFAINLLYTQLFTSQPAVKIKHHRLLIAAQRKPGLSLLRHIR